MPIVPHHQPTPVVQPAMSTLHLPATRADRVHLRRTAGTLASRPMTLRNRGTNPSSSQFPPELCAVVALVSSQRVRSLLGPASSTRDANPVHHIQSHCHLGYAGTGHIEGQRQSLSLRHHVDRAPLTLPSVVDVLSPFLAGTKLPSRNAWLQSSLLCSSRVLRTLSHMCSHTPCSSHSCKRRWQVEELPYRSGRSFQRAPERSTQRIPLRVVLSSALGLPRRLGGGRRGAMTSHCSSRRSSSIAQASTPQTWAID